MCNTDLIPKVMTMSDILLIIAHFTFNTDRIIKRLNIFASIFNMILFVFFQQVQWTMFMLICRCGRRQARREIHHDIRGAVSEALSEPPSF